jgi:hypothetical protein
MFAIFIGGGAAQSTCNAIIPSGYKKSTPKDKVHEWCLKYYTATMNLSCVQLPHPIHVRVFIRDIKSVDEDLTMFTIVVK